MNPKKLDMVCEECGSRKVLRDAWAAWNISAQCWELSTTFENGWCDDCRGEAHIKEVELDDRGA